MTTIATAVPSLRDLHEFELALLDPVLAMTERGLRIDEAKRQAMIAALDAELAPLAREASAIVEPLLRSGMPREKLFVERRVCRSCHNGKNKRLTCVACGGYGKWETWAFNLRSEQQRKVVLYELLKLPARTRKTKLTTDEDALRSLLGRDQSGLVRVLLAATKHTTMRAILERMEPGEDGRLRTWYNVAGTETGRFSSSETWLERSTNLQNLPLKEAARSPLYDVRQCLVPDEGETFVYADLSQAEARVTAALCDDRKLLERWQDATFDVHRWTAAAIFRKPAGEITKAERYLGKMARHALNYGMGWKKFMLTVNADADLTGVSVEAARAKQIVAAYHKLHPALQVWWKRVFTEQVERGELTTIFGRRRRFYGRRRWPDRWLDDPHKEAIAFVPQSTVADLLNRGLLRYWTTYDRNGVKDGGQLQAQVHDAILVGVQQGRGAFEAGAIKSCLEEEIVIGGVPITIPCEVEVLRESWAG